MKDIPGLCSQRDYDPKRAEYAETVYYFHTETGEKKFILYFEVKPNVYYFADAE